MPTTKEWCTGTSSAGNLMVTRRGDRTLVKILDFGLAKASSEDHVDGGPNRQQGTDALGTPDYMAPEQVWTRTRADIRADIYGLGCTLYYLMTGVPPFRAPVSMTSSGRTTPTTPGP